MKNQDTILKIAVDFNPKLTTLVTDTYIENRVSGYKVVSRSNRDEYVYVSMIDLEIELGLQKNKQVTINGYEVMLQGLPSNMQASLLVLDTLMIPCSRCLTAATFFSYPNGTNNVCDNCHGRVPTTIQFLSLKELEQRYKDKFYVRDIPQIDIDYSIL